MEVGFKTLCNFLDIDRGVQRGKNGIIQGLEKVVVEYINGNML